MMTLHNSPPPLELSDLLGPLLPALIIVLCLSRLPERLRLRFNAIAVIGAGAAYIGHGLGPIELVFAAVASFWLGIYALNSFRVIGLCWVLHIVWDVVHHLWATPIWPFLPASSASCATFDSVLALWLLCGAPRLPFPKPNATALILLMLAPMTTSLSGCQFFETYGRIYGECDAPARTDWAEELSAPLAAVKYAPRFALWSDGAQKERWMQLPAGGVIDTSDVNSWRYPVGTRFWKTFSLDGKRLETRLLEKVGVLKTDWRAVSYAWNAAQTQALASTGGAENVLGTQHDIPSAAACFACHGGGPSRILGFSAVQLSDSDRKKILQRRPDAFLSVPSEVHLPGDRTARLARGYLHANCSHCHNARPTREAQDCYNPRVKSDNTFNFSIMADNPQLMNMGHVLIPGDAKRSAMVKRFGHASPFRPAMPPLGTEVLDTNARALIIDWIDSLKPAGDAQPSPTSARRSAQ